MRPSGVGKSSTKIGSLLSLPSMVIEEDRPTDADARDLLDARRRSVRERCAVWTGSSISDSGMAMRSVSTSSGFVKPGSTLRIAWNVRIIRPDATSRTTASAISTTTSVLRARCRAAAGARQPSAFLQRARQLRPSRT